MENHSRGRRDVMDSTCYEAMRATLDMPHNEFADALGIDAWKSRVYSGGFRPVPRVVALAVWALVMRPRVEAFVPAGLPLK